MPKGFGGMPGGLNMNHLMKQAQKMQKQMEDVRAELDERVFETTSGGGAIKAVITGKLELKEITIDPDVVDPDDVEMLQDLVLTAVNEAIRQANAAVNAEMGKLTGGMGLPGGMF
ncbi:MAG: YbaB/EbfC family nucleoid-associated protein [Defluviitaleaceae bacterium]|nr:YbaB/EbfC family nucleoid-associated protein [Defluviitaleaceae bacterium]